MLVQITDAESLSFWFMLYLVAHPDDMFSHKEIHVVFCMYFFVIYMSGQDTAASVRIYLYNNDFVSVVYFFLFINM